MTVDGEHRGHHAHEHLSAATRGIRARRDAQAAHAAALDAERARLDQEIADERLAADSVDRR